MDNQVKPREENPAIRYIDILLRDWKIIVFFTAMVGFVTLIYLLFFANPVFKAHLTILPTAEEAGTFSSLSVLANDLGVDIPGTKVKINTPQIYQRIIASQHMTDQLAKREYRGRKSPRAQTLQEVLGIKAKDPSLEEYFLHEAVHALIKMPLSLKEGTLDIIVTFKDPDIAAQIANNIVDVLDDYNKYFRKSKARNNREYLDKQLADARDELKKAEQKFISFRENNRQVRSSPSLQQELNRMSRAVKLQEEIFLVITKEHEKAKLQEIKDIPIIDIVEKSRPPAIKSNSRTRFLLASVAFGMFLSIVFILGREYYRNSTVVQEIKATQGYRVFTGDLKKIIGKIFPRLKI